MDTWKSPDTGELVEVRRQRMNLTQRPWKGEIIFEMNQEERERRNLHRTMDIEAEQVLADNDPEPTVAPDQSPDEQIQVLKPRTRRQQEAIVTRDGGAQAENRAQDWTGFDVGNALARLRSNKAGVRLRALRQLHLRWFHATIEQMKKILVAAGVPKEVIEMIPQVVHTCRICRRWERHSPKAQVSVRLADRFNQVVQFDLIEYTEQDKKYYIVHLLD